MECKFSKSRNKDESFRYLGLIIHKDREIENYVNHKIRAGWMKWISAPVVLCDYKIPIKF